MNTIPNDIKEIAKAIADEISYIELNPSVIRDEIEGAILAERERCAKIAEARFTAESVLKTVKGEPYITGQAAIYAAKTIASAIRGTS